MQVASSDAQIHYEVLGKGPDLVLLHPFPASHEFWMPVAEALAARYRVTLPDLRGHGASQPGSGPATMEKQATDLARVCDDAGIGKAVFGGVSIGGYVLFEFWRRHRERVAGLMLCCTRANADTEEGRAARLASVDEVAKRGPEPFLDAQIERLVGETTHRNRPDIAAAARRMMGQMTVAGIAEVQRGMAVRPDSTPTLATINVPTLIVAGEEDVVAPLEEAQRMHRAVAGSQLRVISKAGHYAVFERPEAASEIIREFLGGTAKG